MKEIYKAIENFDNYAVSNLGNVRNVKTGRILKSSDNGNGYLVVTLYRNRKRKIMRINRLVAFAFLEKIKNKTAVDHIDGNRTNNNIKNLRFASPHENQGNRKKQSKTASSVFKGVSFHKAANKWRALIRVNKKLVHIGLFKSEVKAAKAYDARAREIFGGFAKLNFPEDDD